MATQSHSSPPRDRELLTSFERAFDPARPERLPAGSRLVGFGEISMVFRVPGVDGRVVKRVAGLKRDETAEYREVVESYVSRLREHGVNVAEVETIEVEPESGRRIVYLVQEAHDPDRFANRRAAGATDEQLETLLLTVLGHVEAVLATGAGLDAQLSNWVLARPDSFDELTYLDLTTPMLRERGRERLDLAFVLRSLPLPIRLGMRAARADRAMMSRYYDRRTVAMDIVSNLIKEGLSRRLPFAIRVVNEWLRGIGERALTLQEVRADYRNDARMWAFLHWIRRPDRWVRKRLLGRTYDWGIAPRIDRRTR